MDGMDERDGLCPLSFSCLNLSDHPGLNGDWDKIVDALLFAWMGLE
jgi:hypothetical protein